MQYGPQQQQFPPRPPYGPPPRRARISPALLAGLIAAPIIVIVVIIGALLPDDKPATTPDESKAAATSSHTPSSPPARLVFEYVDPSARRSFTAALTAIDPGLTVNPARHLGRATNVCYRIYGGEPAAAVLRYTAQEYDGGDASVPQGSDKARRILAAAKKWMCSSGELRAHYDQTHPAKG